MASDIAVLPSLNLCQADDHYSPLPCDSLRTYLTTLIFPEALSVTEPNGQPADRSRFQGALCLFADLSQA